MSGERREDYFHNIENVMVCAPRLHEQKRGTVRLLQSDVDDSDRRNTLYDREVLRILENTLSWSIHYTKIEEVTVNQRRNCPAADLMGNLSQSYMQS